MITEFWDWANRTYISKHGAAIIILAAAIIVLVVLNAVI